MPKISKNILQSTSFQNPGGVVWALRKDEEEEAGRNVESFGGRSLFTYSLINKAICRRALATSGLFHFGLFEIGGVGWITIQGPSQKENYSEHC